MKAAGESEKRAVAGVAFQTVSVPGSHNYVTKVTVSLGLSGCHLDGLCWLSECLLGIGG